MESFKKRGGGEGAGGEDDYMTVGGVRWEHGAKYL